jgi:hypothetical protein
LTSHTDASEHGGERGKDELSEEQVRHRAQGFSAEGKNRPKGSAMPEERRWGRPILKNEDMTVWIRTSLIAWIVVEV